MAHQGVAPTITGYTPALERLADAAERARRGAGGAIVVEGEAGAGKTTLIAEFARRLPPDVRVCRRPEHPVDWEM